MKITIAGGGSTWTPGLLNAITNHKDNFPIDELVLFDNNPERQKIIGEFGKVLFREKYPNLKFSYTTDIKEAFHNVDYVFCQIRTGGYEMRKKDEKIPLSMGLIGQETCGPGGFAYGFRSIPDMIKLVNDIRKYSKDAWILNYTNPAAIVAVALKKEFPNDNRILNICDQPINLLKSYGKILDMDYREFEPYYFGLNHYGWFTKLLDKKGNDLLPKLKEVIKSEGFLPADAEQRDQSWLDTYGMVQQMVEDFDEYLPNTYLQYYLYPKYKLSKLDPNYTRADEVIDGREKNVFNECKKVYEQQTLDGIKMVHNDAHGDMIVEIAMSIEYNLNNYFIVIVENNGIINNLSDDAMVEVTATLGKNGPRPFTVGDISTFYKGMIESQYAYEKLITEAYYEKSYNKALMALTLNRTVIDVNDAKKVLNALIEANKEYWVELD
ncbi:MAG: 6-phospho-alpha-glucosidase [Anaerococcus sp.]|nr:6-phospho-alpha-glucosidase [Anaerococcus sp.]